MERTEEELCFPAPSLDAFVTPGWFCNQLLVLFSLQLLSQMRWSRTRTSSVGNWMLYFQVLQDFYTAILWVVSKPRHIFIEHLCNTVDFVCSQLLNIHIFSHIIFTGSTELIIFALHNIFNIF